MKFFLKLGLILVLTGCLFACSEQEKKQEVSKNTSPPFIQAPIPKLQVSYQSYEFDAEKGGSFEYETGSVISIPQNALVDEDGKSVKGKVRLQYREFHDAIDVMLSGIPMNYDSAGVAQNLQTAGMFEIKASQNDKVLNIAKDKTINVKMASWQSEEDYNFYALDTTARQWEFKQIYLPEINEKKVKMKQALELMTPFDPAKTLILNYEQALDIAYQDNWDLIQANRQAYLWKFKTYGVDYMPNVRLFDPVNFQGNEYPAFMLVWERLDQTAIPNWLKNHKGMLSTYDHDMKATPLGNGDYLIQITQQKTKWTFSSKMRPTMRIASLLQFTPAQWKAKRPEIMEKIRIEEEKIARTAEVFRTVEISDFGIYNFDRMLKEEGAVLVNANFKLPEAKEKPTLVYYINPKTRGVVKYTPQQWQAVTLLPDTSSRIFAIMSDHSIASYRPEDYAKIDFAALDKSKSPKHKFILQSAKHANTRQELERVLGIQN